MHEIYGFLRLASRLANPFDHPSQVRTQVLVLQTCVDLRRLASPFGQGFTTYSDCGPGMLLIYRQFPNALKHSKVLTLIELCSTQ